MRVGVLVDRRVVAIVDGEITGGGGVHVVDISHLLDPPGTRGGVDGVMDRLAALVDRGPAVAAYLATRPPWTRVAGPDFLAPSPRPRTLLAAPVNFAAHLGELGDRSPDRGALDARQLGLIVLAPGSITGPSGRIALPDLPGREFHFEGEIAVVIGRPARDVPERRALEHVLGYTGLIDVTLRLSEQGREERSMRKSYATFTPLGPWLLTADEVPDPAELTLTLSRNGEVRQQGALRDLIVDVPGLVSRASRMLELRPGDVIATGTPSGVGPITPGDQLTLHVSGVGELRMPVVRRRW
jgi:2-keto-4-pentenoate hydratase/2-oxohepta-3-ene-1,7-dioic acid hydratase in catechol pathway